jgi:hypothetical protein
MSGRGHLLGLYLLVLVVDMVLLLLSLVLYEVLNLLLESCQKMLLNQNRRVTKKDTATYLCSQQPAEIPVKLNQCRTVRQGLAVSYCEGRSHTRPVCSDQLRMVAYCQAYAVIRVAELVAAAGWSTDRDRHTTNEDRRKTGRHWEQMTERRGRRRRQWRCDIASCRQPSRD